MPNDQQLDVVQHPILGPLKFPKDMPFEERNASIQRQMVLRSSDHIAGSQTQMPKGPTAPMPKPEGLSLTNLPEGMGEKIGRGATLGAASGAGIPETQTPVKDLFSGMNQQVNKAATTSWAQGGPVYGTLAMLGNMLKGTVKGEAESATETGEGIEKRDPEMIAHGVASGITRPLMFKELAKAPEAVTDLPGQLKTGAQEVLGEGPSKFALKSDLHEHAMRTQTHIQQVADSVKKEATDAMQAVSSKIDTAHPEGIHPKAEIQAKVQNAIGELVKNPENMPASINNILNPPKELTALDQASVFKGAGKQMRAAGSLDDLSPKARAEFYRQNPEAERAQSEEPTATGAGPNWTHEQLAQLRSDVGRDLGGLNKKGVIGAAANKVYGILSDQLLSGAEQVGRETNTKLGDDWTTATGKYKSYKDDFEHSAVRKILKGTNASKIMNPLIGDDAVPVQKTLAKYADHGVNMDALLDEARRFSGAQTVQRFSRPGRLDLIMAGISPKIAALRVGLPRQLRKPGALSGIFGKGFEDVPEISPSKVTLKKASEK